MSKTNFMLLIYFIFVCPFTGAKPERLSTLLINLGPNKLKQYEEFNTEISDLKAKFPQSKILNGGGSGMQFKTEKRDSGNYPIFKSGITSEPATLSNVLKAVESELNDSSKPSFIYLTGHGAFGYSPTWIERDSSREYLDYGQLFLQVKNRPDKEKKVKLMLTTCFSGSFLNEFRSTRDFDGKFCFIATGLQDQTTSLPNFESLKKAKSLNDLAKAYDQEGYSTSIKTSVRFAELAIREMMSESQPPTRCERIPFDIKSLGLDQMRSTFEMPEMLHYVYLYNAFDDADLDCSEEDYLDQNPNMRALFSQKASKFPNDPYHPERVLEQLQSQQAYDVFPKTKLNKPKIFKCIMEKLSKREERNLVDFILLTYSYDKYPIIIDEEDKKYFSSKRYSDDLRALISKRNSLGEKYRKRIIDATIQSPNGLESVSNLLSYTYHEEAKAMSKIIKKTMGDFERLLKTPAGEKYRKTYEALRKCESEPLN